MLMDACCCRRSALWWFALAVVFLTGCTRHAAHPLNTSIADLRSERRLTATDTFIFHEVVTLDGTSPIQLVGRGYHYATPKSRIVSAIGIFLTRQELNSSSAIQFTHRERSYIRSGELPSPGMEVLHGIASIIETIQYATNDLIELRIRRAAAHAADDAALHAELSEKIERARIAISSQRQELRQLMRDSSHPGDDSPAVNNPGIMVVRWSTDQDRDLLLSFNPLGDTAASIHGSKSGFVILGGIRIESLIIGSDVHSLLRNALNSNNEDDKLFRDALRKGQIAFCTYSIQARDIVYANDISSNFHARIDAELSRQTLTAGLELERIAIESDIAIATDFGNFGQIPAMAWTIEDVPPPRDPNAPTPRVGLFTLFSPADPDANDELHRLGDGWKTVYAVLAVPRLRVLSFF